MRCLAIAILAILIGGPACRAGTCHGGSPCRACHDCSRCRHCNSGGSCGACGGGMTEADRRAAVEARVQEQVRKMSEPILKKRAIEAAIARERSRAEQAEADRLRAAGQTLAVVEAAVTRGDRIATALGMARALERQGKGAAAVGYYRAVLELTDRGYEARTAARRLAALDSRSPAPAVVVGPFAPPPTRADLARLMRDLNVPERHRLSDRRRPRR